MKEREDEGWSNKELSIIYKISEQTVARIINEQLGRAQKKVRPLKPCGTMAAYRRHLHRDEDPCYKCKLKAAEVRATYRKRKIDG